MNYSYMYVYSLKYVRVKIATRYTYYVGTYVLYSYRTRLLQEIASE